MRRTSIVFGMKVRMHDIDQGLHTPHITKTDEVCTGKNHNLRFKGKKPSEISYRGPSSLVCSIIVKAWRSRNSTRSCS